MPKSSELSFETEVELDGVNVEVTVVYGYTPGTPGRVTGPPENCYPPEGPEADFHSIYVTDDPTKTDIQSRLSEAVLDDLSQRAAEEGDEAARDAYEAAMEDAAEYRRERDRLDD